MALNTPTVAPVNIPPVDHIDIIEGNPAVSAPGAMRLSRQRGVLMVSIDGAPYVPLAAPFAAMESPGVLSVAGIAITTLTAWFKADAGITFGTWPAVSTWADQSGNSARDLTGLVSPAYVSNSINGRPGITCVSATATYFRNNAVSINAADRGPRTIYFVGKANSTTGGYQVCSRLAAGAFLSAHRNSAGTIFAHLAGSGDNQTLTDLPAIQGVPTIWRHSNDGRQAFIGANCATRVTMNGLDKGLAGGGFAVAETGTAGFSVGGWDGDTANGWNGDVSEVLWFSRVLTRAEDRLVMQYLSSKYGITVLDKVDTMCLGDSGFFGSLDATTLANGGPRSRIYGGHPQLQGSGSLYAPLGGDGSYQRCEGNVGYTSGAPPVTATGIGGSYLVTALGANPVDLILLQIGENDALGPTFFTAPQTAANVRAIVDTIYATLPNAKIIVARSMKASTANAAANLVIAAQGPAIETALGPSGPGGTAPNVIACGPGGTRCLIPPDVADSLYQGDGIHLLDGGQAIHYAQMWNPGLLAAGY